jgi:PAS domain S-box-containing protein
MARTLPPGNVKNAELAELAELRAQLREAQETLEAIRGGAVDSLMIGPPGQEQVYAIASADRTYRLIVKSMNEGAATISPRGMILDANPHLCALTGQAPSKLIGTPVLDLILDAQRTKTRQMLDIGVGESARDEVWLAGPDGTIVPVLLAVSAFDLDGMLLRGLVMTDLSAQRRAEEEVRTLNGELETRVEQRTAELKQANMNLEAFTYSVAHDLRAPLRALSGFSEALLEEYGDRLDETAKGYAGRIVAASERMAALIDGLLLLSRVLRTGMNLGPVNLSAEVASILDELQLQARAPDRRVRFAIADDVWVTADRPLIRSALQNLIENAWKFTARRDDALIEFGTTAAEDPGICCYMRDNGAGFDPAYADKLFQPFQRLHTVGEFPGTGIGLASVQRVIERHGGRVWAHGAVDEGATFYFTLASSSRPLNDLSVRKWRTPEE